jgi:ACS family glucarate transporter-like MFS transporter
MCFAFVGWTFFFWFPTYLVEGRGLSMAVMGTAGIVVHGAGFVGIIGGGAISDWLLRRGWSGQFARVRFAGIAVILSLPFLLGTALVPSAMMSVGCLILFYLLFASAIAGYVTVALEFNPHLAGAIFGLLNTLGSVSSIFGPAIAGFLLVRSGGDWTVPFSVLTTVGVVGAVILLLVRITPIRAEALAPSDVVAREAAR